MFEIRIYTKDFTICARLIWLDFLPFDQFAFSNKLCKRSLLQWSIKLAKSIQSSSLKEASLWSKIKSKF